MSIKIGSKYEWIRGDYMGEIDEVSDIDNDFVIFKNGRRCNIDVFNEYLLPAGTNKITRDIVFKGVTGVDFIQEDEGQILDENGIPVIIPKTEVIKRDINLNNNAKNDQNFSESKKINPINLLITQSSKEDYILNIEYSVKLPKKSTYFLLKESFENIDIDSEILDSIVSEIDINEFRSIFKKQLLEKIKLYYNS